MIRVELRYLFHSTGLNNRNTTKKEKKKKDYLKVVNKNFNLQIKVTLTEQLLVMIRLLRLTTCDIGLEGMVICCVPKLLILLVFPD